MGRRESCVVGTAAIDMLESYFGFANGLDDNEYVLMQLPEHTDYLPDRMVGALAIPVLGNANIPQGEPVALVWLDAYSFAFKDTCKAAVVSIDENVIGENADKLRQLLTPQEVDKDEMRIRHTEIQAILENGLYADEKEENELATEMEHIEVLLGEELHNV